MPAIELNAVVAAATSAQTHRRGEFVSPVKLDPHQFFRRIPLAPHQMQDRLTRVEHAIVLCHLGVPRIAREDWSLTIDGLVSSPRRLTFADLTRFPRFELTSVHQCAGSPLQPSEPTQRVCNVKWAGARLADILSLCRPRVGATFVWSTGADFGQFDDVSVDAYVKDLPIERVASDVLIAYEMNDEGLSPEHGFPARLVVPGFYGTNSVKWLTRVTLAETRAPGPFTTRWYNDPAQEASGSANGRTAPVWSLAPQSVIVAPAPDVTLVLSQNIEIWGWAWADGGVGAVEVAIDDATWRSATLEAAAGRAWQRFAMSWTPQHRGTAVLTSRATSVSGELQPESGRRNAIYRIPVTIV
jgi:DMSO/TMAO reductase YedYZ molybdopterin-dependent catalytic subunit